MGSVKALGRRVRKFEAREILSLVTHSLAIVAFLVAIDYFTRESSIEILVQTQGTGYFMDSVIRFYGDNELSIPRQLLDDTLVAHLFTREVRQRDGRRAPFHEADLEVIQALREGDSLDWWLLIQDRIVGGADQAV